MEDRLLFSTYIVTTVNDWAGTLVPGTPGIVYASTLRAAINAANAAPGADSVAFSPGLTGTINLATKLPNINDALTVKGNGASKLTVRQSLTAVSGFSVFTLAAGKTASISGLTIKGGTGTVLPGHEPPNAGGGIFNAGNLSLANCVISNNITSWLGGGIYNTGSVTLTGSTIADNASPQGGGLANLGTAKLTNCTLRGNSDEWFVEIPNYNGTGAAIYNGPNATLTLARSNVTANALQRYSTGGGISNLGTMSLSDTKVSNNSASDAGGIYNAGNATLTRCTVANNAARSDRDSDGHGGGIWNEGSLTLTHSTVSGNTTESYDGGRTAGGGIYNLGTAKLANSTIAGNQAIGYTEALGAGVYNERTASLTNCTVTGNTSASAINASAGAGISHWGSTLTLNNTIVAGNTAGAINGSGASDLSGAATSSTFNVIGTGGSGGLVNGVNGNKVGVTLAQLRLGTLAFNGGPTQTIALLPGSVAINAGSNAKAVGPYGNALTTDQRGTGYPRIVGGTTDVGAFEALTGKVSGIVFKDTNGNGKKDPGEPGVKGWLVWADLNGDGKLNSVEPRATSNLYGNYIVNNVPTGSQFLRLEKRTAWQQTYPAGGAAHKLTIVTDKLLTGWHFGVKPILG